MSARKARQARTSPVQSPPQSNMDFTPSNPSDPAPASEPGVMNQLGGELDRLHFLFRFAAGALLLLSLAADLFLLQQMRLVRMQLPAQREAVLRQSLEFQKRDEPLIRDFIIRLQQFSTTNADFRVVLDQYRPALTNYFRFASEPPKTTPPPAKK